MADDRWGNAGAGAASGASAGSAFGPWGTAIGAVVGGVGGYLSGGGTNQQTTQYIPPTLNPQQTGLQNLLYYGALSNLYPQQAGYQDLLSQYIYGGMPGTQTTQPGAGTGAEQIISGYQQQKKQAAETETQLKGLEGDLTEQTVKPLIDLTRELNELSPTDRAKRKEELINTTKEVSQQLQDLTGRSKAVADKLSMQIANGGGIFSPFAYMKLSEAPADWKGFSGDPGQENYTWAYIKTNIVPSDLGYGGSMYEGAYRDFRHANTETDITNLFVKNAINKGETLEDINSSSIIPLRKDIWDKAQEELNIQQSTEQQAQDISGTLPAQGIEQTGVGAMPQQGILGQIMDPSYIAEQFGLAKEAGMEEISDWYSQAARELEQRGIAQHGGLMGSQYERDVGGLLGRRGEMQTQLGSGLRQAEIALERQNWYDVLNALTGLQAQQANLYAQRTSPWISAAQNIANAPYGTSTQITTTPGVGAWPAAISGAYTGAGLAQSLGNWGWGQQPATAAGAGMAGSSGLNLAGTQNLWNQYAGSNLWG